MESVKEPDQELSHYFFSLRTRPGNASKLEFVLDPEPVPVDPVKQWYREGQTHEDRIKRRTETGEKDTEEDRDMRT